MLCSLTRANDTVLLARQEVETRETTKHLEKQLEREKLIPRKRRSRRWGWFSEEKVQGASPAVEKVHAVVCCFDFCSYDGAKSACVRWVGGFESKLGGVVANNEAAFPLKSPQSRRINQRALWLPGRCFLSEPLSRFIRSNGAGAHVAISCRHRLSAAFVMLQRN